MSGPPGASFPGLPLVNSSPAANVAWGMTTFPFATSSFQTSLSTPSAQDTSVTMASLLAAQTTRPSNALPSLPLLSTSDTASNPAPSNDVNPYAALHALYAALANPGAMEVGTGRGMFASMPGQGVQPVSTWQGVHSVSPNLPTTSHHQLNTFQLPPVPTALSAQAPQGGLLFHGSSFQSSLGSSFGSASFAQSFVPHPGGQMHMSGAHGPNKPEGGHKTQRAEQARGGAHLAGLQDSPATPERSVVPRRRGKVNPYLSKSDEVNHRTRKDELFAKNPNANHPRNPDEPPWNRSVAWSSRSSSSRPTSASRWRP